MVVLVLLGAQFSEGTPQVSSVVRVDLCKLGKVASKVLHQEAPDLLGFRVTWVCEGIQIAKEAIVGLEFGHSIIKLFRSGCFGVLHCCLEGLYDAREG